MALLLCENNNSYFYCYLACHNSNTLKDGLTTPKKTAVVMANL